MIKETLVYGDERIDYEVIFSPNRSKKIAIHVHPNASVQIDAPDDRELSEIKSAVQKRARWISKNVSDALQIKKNVLPRLYISGESYFYLGRRYQLKVRKSDIAKGTVKLLRGSIEVETASLDRKTIRALLRNWYREKATAAAQQRFEALADGIVWLDELPTWRLLKMRKQWGSCSPKGEILLNPHLVKASRECMDYVILHEICHFKEHNHSKRFYRLLEQMMPNYRSVKAKLDGMAELVLNE